MKLHIQHTTSYKYENDVAHSTQYLRLTPSDSSRQKILSWVLDLPTASSRSIDAYGNILHVITVDFPHQEIIIKAEGYVDVDDSACEQGDRLSPLVFLRPTPLTKADAELIEFALPEVKYVRSEPEKAARHLMERMHKRMSFQPGETTVCTTAAESFQKRQGVCQDYAHVYLALAHSIGLPARYASGYLYTADTEHVVSHAWVEVWIKDHWWGLDVANGIEAGHHHLKLAVGLDYLEACPIRGSRTGGGSETLQANARVQMMDQQQQ
jgi:transglutaminase-like putative cysteine protease